jgi:aquaporin Z
MKKYITEAIGTFFFVLVVVMTCNNGSGNMAPLAIGCTLMVMVYAGGHISGGHFNPAVSLAVLIRGKLDKKDFPFYVIAQLIGGFFAATVAVFLLESTKTPEIIARVNDPISAIVAELLGTFSLAWTVLNVATTKSNSGNSHYGLAIGFSVVICAYALGSVSGGAFNPAIALGLCTSGMASFSDYWMYLLGDVLGAAAAATVFGMIYGNGD